MTEEAEATTDVQSQLDTLRADNIRRLEALQAEGYGLNPLMQLKLRLDTLTAVILDDDALAGFELVYETLMAQEVERTESEIVRLKLTEGISGGKELR